MAHIIFTNRLFPQSSKATSICIGLHADDVAKPIDVLHRLVAQGAPEQIAHPNGSRTTSYLKDSLSIDFPPSKSDW